MQLRSFYLRSTFDGAHVRNIPGSLHPHNFNVCDPEWRSLGTRLATPCYVVVASEVSTSGRIGGSPTTQAPIPTPAPLVVSLLAMVPGMLQFTVLAVSAWQKGSLVPRP